MMRRDRCESREQDEMAHDHGHGGHAHGASGGGPGRLAPADAVRVTGRVTALSVLVATVLSALKLAATMATGSVAILASLADSALDLVASLATFFAVRYAAEPADREHRFGHGKAEAFAAIFQAGVVSVSALLLARQAAIRFLEPAPIAHGVWALAVMAASLLLTAGLIFAQTRAVRATGSVAVTGDRLHYASDFAANIAVIAGVVLAMAGFWRADAVVAAAVAVWLLWGAWGVAREALDQMMDRELPDADRERIRALALQDDRLLDIHDLRTRAAGPLIHIQFHADLDPALTLEAAHRIIVAAEQRILAVYPGADVLIHPDPHGRAEPHGAAHFSGEAVRDV